MLLSSELRYLTVKDVARRFSVSVNTIWRWTSTRPEFPKPIKLGAGCTRFRSSDLDAFERAMGAGQ
jgi:predicted DNA-binding transcriptional regulator AlpA